MNLGIISSDYIDLTRQTVLDQENADLARAARKFFEKAHQIDPTKLELRLLDNRTSVIYHKTGEDKLLFETLDVLIVKRTRGFVEQIGDIIEFSSKSYPNLLIFDPPKTYIKPLSKIPGLLARVQVSSQPNTQVILNSILPESTMEIKYPVVVKPIHGFQGIDVNQCNNKDELKRYFEDAAKEESQLGYGHLIQEKIDIAEEYRVIIIGDEAVGCVRKTQHDAETIARNRNQGAEFENSQDFNAMTLAIQTSTALNLSFAGVDILKDSAGEYHVLECNRNPQYNYFEKTTGIDVSKKIIEYVINQVEIHKSVKLNEIKPDEIVKMNKKIFIGSSSGAGKKIANYILSELSGDYDCNVWDKGVFSLSSTTIESLLSAVNTHDYAILVMTPDDFAEKKGDKIFLPRDNVIFELGLFMGGIGRDRTFIIASDNFDLEGLPTDLSGLTIAKLPKRTDGNLAAQVRVACLGVREKIETK